MKKQATMMLLLGVLLAGCSNSSAPKEEPNAPAAAKSGVSMVFIPKSSANAYFDNLGTGIDEAKKTMGFESTTQAPAAADATSQLSVIKDQVQRGVNAIILSSNSPDALNVALDEARGKGVKLITVDSDLTGNETHRDVGVMPVDPKTIGPSQIELLGKLMNYEGEFAILSATADAPNQNAWIEGMKETLKDAKYAKMKLVATVYGDDEAQKSSTETEGLLTKYPNLKGILSPTSVGLAAAAQVIENAGVYPGGEHAKNGGLILTGLSTPDQLRKAVEKGVIQSFQLWVPADAGFVAASIANDLCQKKIEIKPGSMIKVPGKGDLKVEDKNIVFVGPLITFDKSNIDKYHF